MRIPRTETPRPIVSSSRLPSVGAAFLLAGAASASATVVGTFTNHGDGSYTYHYRIDNSAGTFDISQWSLEFGFSTPDWTPLTTASGGDVAVPDPNWDASAGPALPGSFTLDFLSLDPASDVGIGSSLGGFSFLSRFEPGTVAFTEFAADGSTSFSGTTLGPVVKRPNLSDEGSMLGLAMTAGLGLSLTLKSRSARPANRDR